MEKLVSILSLFGERVSFIEECFSCLFLFLTHIAAGTCVCHFEFVFDFSEQNVHDPAKVKQ